MSSRSSGSVERDNPEVPAHAAMKLYYLPGTAAMAPHMALEEAGADYELVLVERDNGQVVDPPNYRELNPHDLVPTLVDGDLVLHEAAAVVMYLSDAYPDAALAPAPGTAARGHWYRWLTYLTNTVQPAQLNRLYPERYTTDAHGSEGVRRAGEAILEQMRAWIDGELGRNGPYLLGETFTSADLYLCMLTRWSRTLEPKWWDSPSLGSHYRRIVARPAVVRVYEQQGLEE
ncbi:MAG: glutathione S-transferase family protein [Actinomycetia bacterium]|nr:glutathione S-transferase family protein [Actinomycetes bacterium]